MPFIAIPSHIYIYTRLFSAEVAPLLGPQKMDSEMVSRARIQQPCAACKILRRRCDNSCVLAPYFPYEDREKFVIVHKVFGASNVIKMIQMVEEMQREDAVKAIVYEATARLRDPVYGSAGATFQLYKMVQQLKMEIETVKAQITGLQEQNNALFNILTYDHHSLQQHRHPVASTDEPTVDWLDTELHDGGLGYDPVKFPVECDWIL